jgi:hypothetical protein
MNKRIIYKTAEGGVAILIPAPEARKQVLVSEAVYETQQDEEGNDIQVLVSEAVYRDETDEEFLAWVAAKDVPDGIEYKVVDVSEIPEDRTFRNAWEMV